MKTFEQLAQSAYKAFCKQFGPLANDEHPHPTWDELGPLSKSSWIAAAKQVAAEIAAIH
jgi:hypothetical protein